MATDHALSPTVIERRAARKADRDAELRREIQAYAAEVVAAAGPAPVEVIERLRQIFAQDPADPACRSRAG